MEEISSSWNYEDIIDELKEKLLYTTLELQTVREQGNAEKSKNKEYIFQLFQLLNTVYKERDEAKDQYQKLLNKIMPCNSTELLLTPYPQLQPNSPIIKPTKANSTVTECNSLSDTYNSSPATSIFDNASSPELSNLKQPFVHDDGSLKIDKIIKGKSLPEKGKLVNAMRAAGPLLQTLMVTGLLPQWRNPPPHQPFEVPPFCVNNSLDTSFMPKPLDSPFVGMNYDSSHMMMPTSSMVNFGAGAYGCSLSNAASIAGMNVTTDYGSSGKRQRFK